MNNCIYCDRPYGAPHFYACPHYKPVPHRASYSHHGENGPQCGECGKTLAPGKRSGTWKHVGR
jgi:hypothetical protein